MLEPTHEGGVVMPRFKQKEKPRLLMGPFAAILIGALFLIALQWFRNGPGAIGFGTANVKPAVFNGSPHTLAEGITKAAAEKKTLIAFATASWCGPCQSFKRGALSETAVMQAMNQAGVPAYIDVDEDQKGAGDLKVFSIPVLIALRDGKEVGRLEGNQDAEDVVAWLGSLPK
jgi:thioredoxin 2